ncbi:MAG TPA: hypothetical protein VGF28_12650 [Thermoanaerobaculia bacterium]|jgi:hypothetical protein
MKTTISRSLAVLSLSLLALTLGAAPPPDDIGKAAVVAHLAKGEGENARAHVQVQLHRSTVTDVTVELFDADGAVLHTYALKAREGTTYRPVMTVEVAPVFAAAAHSARVTAFSIRSAGEREAVFDTGLLNAVPVTSCTGMCSPTRIQCNNECFCAHCSSAIYSCTEVDNECVASCTCTDCTVGQNCNEW